MRCHVCDFTNTADSLFHNSSVDNADQRGFHKTEKGVLCDHCFEDYKDSLTEFEPLGGLGITDKTFHPHPWRNPRET